MGWRLTVSCFSGRGSGGLSCLLGRVEGWREIGVDGYSTGVCYWNP